MLRQILSVSYDKTLLDTRAKILQQHGYAVSSADNLRDAIELCGKQSFDAAVIGHSIPGADQRQIAAKLREACPGVFVLALQSHVASNVSFADVAVDAYSPHELVAALDGKFGGDKSGKAAAE